MTRNREPKERLVRMAEVRERTGLARASIYRMMADGTFPALIRLGPATVAWRESEIDAWILATIAEAERLRERERDTEAA
jgi:prophage regulatory protein